MKPYIYILTILVLFAFQPAEAQIGLTATPELKDQLLKSDLPTVALFPQANTKSIEIIDTQLPSGVPQAFFCRIEWALEKKVNVPIRFRLGTVEYVDRLEGKY